ncbi:MAG: CcmD family protein [Candidatus Korobacteraceae bacterium]
MTGPVALKAAYIVTWVILLGYLGSLLGRFRRVREEMKDLERGK